MNEPADDGERLLLAHDDERIVLQRLDPRLARYRRRWLAFRLARTLRQTTAHARVDYLDTAEGPTHLVIRTHASDEAEASAANDAGERHDESGMRRVPRYRSIESAVDALARYGPHGRRAGLYVTRCGRLVRHLYCRGPIVCLSRQLDLHDATSAAVALSESLDHLHRHEVLCNETFAFFAGLDDDELLSLARHACIVERRALDLPDCRHQLADPLWHSAIGACFRAHGDTTRPDGRRVGFMSHMPFSGMRVLPVAWRRRYTHRVAGYVRAGSIGVALCAGLVVVGLRANAALSSAAALETEIGWFDEQTAELREHAHELTADPVAVAARVRRHRELVHAIAATRRPVLHHLADVLETVPPVSLLALDWRQASAEAVLRDAEPFDWTRDFTPGVRTVPGGEAFAGWHVRLLGQVPGLAALGKRQAVVRRLVRDLQEHPAFVEVHLVSSPVDAWRTGDDADSAGGDTAHFELDLLLAGDDR